MQKAVKYNVADSNIANLGTELEKNVKLEAAKHEDAWKGAGKEVGIQIWRIEKFKVRAVPKETYGQFFSGDSYIVLWTYKPKPDSPKLAYDAHFWLGKYTTQDEAGTAAYKTVELDDVLGGVPVQYREVQGYESERFMSHFKNGIRILDGGIETGFKNVKAAEYRTRLMHLKGKKQIRVKEVPLSHASLNSGDVFILDAGLQLIQWNGSKSGGMEKAKGAQMVQAIETERMGKAKGSVVAETDDDAEFWKLLGGKGTVASAEEGGSDEEPSLAAQDKVLFRLSDASGAMEFTEVGKGKKVSKSLLDANDVFILDAGIEVYAWVGSKSSAGEKKSALSFAQEYVTKKGKHPNTPVVRILEGGENPAFLDMLQ